MFDETKRWSGLETGGVLIGYWNESQAVVTTVVGPGPNAIHGKRRFVPDQDFHEKAVAEIYLQSGRVVTYLGDWHSHLAGEGLPSLRDVATMVRIARSPKARANTPLMVIITVHRRRAIRAWVLERQPSAGQPAVVAEADVRISGHEA